ncbi:MAG: DUF4832 domain-containing protein [Treponema sp.]|nr:DUF4832 domain-containing protein [Treponema sp.]
MRNLFFIFIIFVLLACNPEGNNNGIDNPSQEPLVFMDSGIDYTESTESIVNPGRGFYRALAHDFSQSSLPWWWNQTDITNMTINTGNWVPGYPAHSTAWQGAGILHFHFGLSPYSANAMPGASNRDISQGSLSVLRQVLGFVRNSDATAILRFSYDIEGPASSDPPSDREPGMEWIERHIEQLGVVIEEFRDVVSMVESGMFGPWGEQHSTTISDPANEENYYRLVEAWLKAVPSRRINVRRPLYFRHWANERFGQSHGINLTDANMANFQIREGMDDAYRVGVYNDGYLGSHNDLGTFSNREQEVRWLANHTRHTYYGGEVVADSNSDVTGDVIGDFNNINFIKQEAFRTHTSYLNWLWNYQVIGTWIQNIYSGSNPIYNTGSITEYNYISNHLGYRIVIRESAFTESRPGRTTSFKLVLENVGFGNVLNQTRTQVIISQNSINYVYDLDLDIRRVTSGSTAAGGELVEFNFNIGLPSNIPPGEWNVYLKISDVLETTGFNRRIRFANNGDIWNPALAANYLGTIVVQ